MQWLIPLSIVLGLIIGWAIHRLNAGISLVVGAVAGLAIYIVNFYMIAPAVFPWFIEAPGWISIMAHIAFGLVLAGAYLGLRKKEIVR